MLENSCYSFFKDIDFQSNRVAKITRLFEKQ